MADNDTIKSPRAILGIDQSIDESVVTVLDDTDYMLLGRSSCNRADLMLYALALGWDNHLHAEIEKMKSGGFARTESFSDQLSAIIKLVHLSTIGYDNIDKLGDINAGYSIFEQYANGGFHLLEGDLQEGLDSEERANKIIADLNDRFECIIKDKSETYY